jgi:carbon starvation protein
MLQELLGHVWEPLGRTSWYPSSMLASALVVSGWGWFLIQGVGDPNGGINSLWPLFGISNQLLATVALCVATTVIIKAGKARYAWVTLLPLAWLLAVTCTASWQKVLSPDPKLGFLALAGRVEQQVAAGEMTAALGRQVAFNARLDAVLAVLFVAVTLVVVVSSAREWLAVLSGRKPALSRETPFVETAYAN